jgi:hypothetical protein
MIVALDGHLLLFSPKNGPARRVSWVGENRGIWFKNVNFTNLTLAKNLVSKHIFYQLFFNSLNA